MPVFHVIGLSTLEYLGIQSILESKGIVSIEFYPTFNRDNRLDLNGDIYITNPVVALSNIDFFLPRRARTIIVTNSDSADISQFNTICRFDDSLKITSIIDNVVQDLKDTPGSDNLLSPREEEVLRGVAAGKTNKEIAEELCISVNTVITHRKNLSTKLGIRSVSGLSLYALMNGLT